MDANHFKVNLPETLKIDNSLELNYLIFVHRDRGTDWDRDFRV